MLFEKLKTKINNLNMYKACRCNSYSRDCGRNRRCLNLYWNCVNRR